MSQQCSDTVPRQKPVIFKFRYQNKSWCDTVVLGLVRALPQWDSITWWKSKRGSSVWTHRERESRGGQQKRKRSRSHNLQGKAEGTGTEKTEGKMIVSTKYSQGCLKENAMFFTPTHIRNKVRFRIGIRKVLKIAWVLQSLSPCNLHTHRKVQYLSV